MYQHRTLIVPAPVVEQARAMALFFPATEGMWQTALALKAAPTVPVAYIAYGSIADEFAAILPLTEWSYERSEPMGPGAWVRGKHFPGETDLIAEKTGYHAAAVQAIFNVCDVSTQTAADALDRLGMVVIRPVFAGFQTPPKDNP